MQQWDDSGQPPTQYTIWIDIKLFWIIVKPLSTTYNKWPGWCEQRTLEMRRPIVRVMPFMQLLIVMEVVISHLLKV